MNSQHREYSEHNEEMECMIKRLESTASSDSSNNESPDDLDECFDSIFEWFASKNIVRGSPEQHYEEYMNRKREALRPVQVLTNGTALAANLLKRRQALKQ